MRRFEFSPVNDIPLKPDTKEPLKEDDKHRYVCNTCSNMSFEMERLCAGIFFTCTKCKEKYQIGVC